MKKLLKDKRAEEGWVVSHLGMIILVLITLLVLLVGFILLSSHGKELWANIENFLRFG